MQTHQDHDPATAPPPDPSRGAGWPHLLVVLLRIVAGVSLFVMAVLTFVDVVGRYFHMPVFGAAEMIQYLLALTVFAGMGLACVSGSHIAVDILDPWLRRRVPRAQRALIWVCNTAAFVLIVWQIGRLGIEGIRSGRRSIVLEWPEGWLIAVLAILAFGALILDLIHHREARDPDETPEEVI